jgi:uncharacterized protein
MIWGEIAPDARPEAEFLMSDKLIVDGPFGAPVTIILAHGAGAPMDSPFMDFYANGIAAAGMRCVRFEFPYMVERRASGSRRPPNTMPVLIETWAGVIDRVLAESPDTTLIIGGKSMGGRVATMIVAEDSAPHVAGVVCLGYPFHPAGRPEKLRVDHLAAMKTPTLIIQGTRDTLGNSEDVAGYTLSDAISVHWLGDGDHSFKPRKASGRTEAQNWQEGVEALVAFAGECSHG